MSVSNAADGLSMHFCTAVFASSAIGVAIWDDARRLVLGNGALASMFAIEPRRGADLSELVPPEQRAGFDALLSEVAEGQTSRLFEVSSTAKGTARLLGVAIGARDLGGGACLFVDVGERPRSRAPDTAIRMAAIGALSASVAHEINNPLAYAMGNLGFAIEHLETAADATPELGVVLLALRDALEGSERVRRTVRYLKTFSRPSADHKGPVNLERVLSAAVSMARADVQHRARLSVDVAEVPSVVGTEGHLAEVFLTLLFEAARDIDEGHVGENEVRLVARPASSHEVVVDVVGTGVHDRTPARPVLDLAESSGELGGFGLAFCRRAVTEYGGTLSVKSSPGGPRSFRVVLPIAGAPSVKPPRPDRGPARAKVLVVDDELRIGSAITRILGPEHDVVAVQSAIDALARLESGEEEYDVILCDLMMPEMSGVDLFRSLEGRAPRYRSRMVFMTGGPFSTRGADLLESVANPRLEKPFSPEALREVVEGLAAKRARG